MKGERDVAAIRALGKELAEAKTAWAEAFIHARQGLVGGKAATVEDAKAGARVRMAARNVRDPEVIRVDLAALGVVLDND